VTAHRRKPAKRRRALTVALLAAVVAIAVIATLALQSTPSAKSSCKTLNVPAYFYSSAEWAAAYQSKPAPGTMILDISGLGAGTSPNSHFASIVKKAQQAGVTILGYSSTEDGQRPVAEVEADIRNYKAWYGVTGVFLDLVSGQPEQISYYRELASYVHQVSPGAPLWLNPGNYPADQGYMSIGSVVMVFEGTYVQYSGLHLPGWASRYPAARFADTVYAASQSELSSALALASKRHTGHVYVTDGSGSNPYSSLPSYWASEVSTVSAACQAAAQAAPGQPVSMPDPPQ
jgi:hypothetical protein